MSRHFPKWHDALSRAHINGWAALLIAAVLALFCGSTAAARDIAEVVSLRASSTLQDAQKADRYSASKAFDGDPTTAWVEGKADRGIGEYVELQLQRPITVDTFTVMPGYFDSRYHKANNRVKTLKVSTESVSFALPCRDEMKRQRFRLKDPITFSRITFEIGAVYKGSRWDDTCIAEITFYRNGKKIALGKGSTATEAPGSRVSSRGPSSEELSRFKFSVPEEVANESITFKPLVEPPIVEERREKKYVLVTAGGIPLRRNADNASRIVRDTALGDLFYYDAKGDLPGNMEDLPEDQYGKITERYGKESYVAEAYARNPGIIIDGHYNKWIRVSDGRTTGWIFGAYTQTYQDYYEAVEKRELYKRGSAFRSYQDYIVEGWSKRKRAFPAGFKKTLQKEYILLEKVGPDEYSLSAEAPDDMIALYQDLAWTKLNPIIITTDVVMHVLHLLFDRALQDVEEQKLLPLVRRLTRSQFDEVAALKRSYGGRRGAEGIDTLLGYFGVALNLLGDYKRQDETIIPGTVRSKMSAELKTIESAEGPAKSALFGGFHDYSQYRPRGHYTRTDALRVFFKAMMWYGTRPFCIDKLDHTRMAMLLSRTVARNPDLMASYRGFFDSLTALIGETDDYTVFQYLEIMDGMRATDIRAILEGDDLVRRFAQQVKSELPPPRISPDVVGLKFVGQRFTLDALYYTLLSHDRVRDRRRIKTFDIAAGLQSAWGEEQLDQDRAVYEGFSANLQQARDITAGIEPEDWHVSFYSGYLASLRQLLIFPRNTGVPWFDCQRYELKNHLAFFGAYAELKHDTVLFTKQATAAEMGGMEFEIDYDWEREPYAKARGYVEPNLPFFENLLSLYQGLMESAAGELLLSSQMGGAFKSFFKEVAWMRDVVARQVRFQSIAERSYLHIFDLPGIFAGLITPTRESWGNMSYIEDTDRLKMAVVSDIFTNPAGREVLQVATGMPQRLYMTIFDPAGGRRVCLGYTYSFFEFWHPMKSRMTDEEWKRIVYRRDADNRELWNKEPAWVGTLRGLE